MQNFKTSSIQKYEKKWNEHLKQNKKFLEVMRLFFPHKIKRKCNFTIVSKNIWSLFGWKVQAKRKTFKKKQSLRDHKD